MSEGLDFKNCSPNAVINVGVPYPSLGDPKIRAKREFNNIRARLDGAMLDGDAWYNTHTFRAVSQGINWRVAVVFREAFRSVIV